LENGFLMGEHDVIFHKSINYISKHLVEIFRELKLNKGIIGKIASLERDENFGQKVKSLQEDSSKADQAVLRQIVSSNKYHISMKSFTELRDNQKINPKHVGYFGNYGIPMKNSWVKESKATPVIYVGINDEFAKKLGLIVSFI